MPALLERIEQSRAPAKTASPSRTLLVPAVAAVAVVAAGAFSTGALRDAATGSAVADVALVHSARFLAFSPFFDVLDMLTLLSSRQHIAFAVTVLLGYSVWRLANHLHTRRLHAPTPRRWMTEVGKCLLAVVVLAGIYLTGLLPRPAAALRANDPNVVSVDFHSHTSASRDGRRGFSTEANRAWHREGGFDAAFITDHRSFEGAAAGQRLNPRLAGDGMAILPGIEVGREGQYINVLGIERSSRGANLPDTTARAEQRRTARSSIADPLILITLPANLSGVARAPGGARRPVDLIELTDASPRGFGQTDSARSTVLHLADSLDIAVAAGSNNHGWGWTAAAWSLLDIPGWRGSTPDALAGQITRVIRLRRRGAVRVVERQRPTISSGPALTLIVPAAVWSMLRALDSDQRFAWLAWIGITTAAVSLSRRRQRPPSSTPLASGIQRPMTPPRHEGEPRLRLRQRKTTSVAPAEP